MATLAGMYLSLGPVREHATAYILVAAALVMVVFVAVLLIASAVNERLYDAARRAGRRQG